LPTVNETVIGLLMATVVGKAAGLLKKSAVYGVGCRISDSAHW
jgi:hypothetical protein